MIALHGTYTDAPDFSGNMEYVNRLFLYKDRFYDGVGRLVTLRDGDALLTMGQGTWYALYRSEASRLVPETHPGGTDLPKDELDTLLRSFTNRPGLLSGKAAAVPVKLGSPVDEVRAYLAVAVEAAARAVWKPFTITEARDAHAHLEDTLAKLDAYLGSVYTASGLDATADVFVKEPRSVWHWYSWHDEKKRWYRSCWGGDTPERAAVCREGNFAKELNDYTNVLVRETTTFCPVTTPAKP